MSSTFNFLLSRLDKKTFESKYEVMSSPHLIEQRFFIALVVDLVNKDILGPAELARHPDVEFTLKRTPAHCLCRQLFGVEPGAGGERCRRPCQGGAEPHCGHDQRALSEQYELQRRAKKQDTEHFEYPTGDSVGSDRRVESGDTDHHPGHFPAEIRTR